MKSLIPGDVGLVDQVLVSWRAWTAHAKGCTACSAAYELLMNRWQRSGEMDVLQAHQRTPCKPGRDLLERWLHAKDSLAAYWNEKAGRAAPKEVLA